MRRSESIRSVSKRSKRSQKSKKLSRRSNRSKRLSRRSKRIINKRRVIKSNRKNKSRYPPLKKKKSKRKRTKRRKNIKKRKIRGGALSFAILILLAFAALVQGGIQVDEIDTEMLTTVVKDMIPGQVDKQGNPIILTDEELITAKAKYSTNFGSDFFEGDPTEEEIKERYYSDPSSDPSGLSSALAAPLEVSLPSISGLPIRRLDEVSRPDHLNETNLVDLFTTTSALNGVESKVRGILEKMLSGVSLSEEEGSYLATPDLPPPEAVHYINSVRVEITAENPVTKNVESIGEIVFGLQTASEEEEIKVKLKSMNMDDPNQKYFDEIEMEIRQMESEGEMSEQRVSLINPADPMIAGEQMTVEGLRQLQGQGYSSWLPSVNYTFYFSKQRDSSQVPSPEQLRIAEGETDAAHVAVAALTGELARRPTTQQYQEALQESRGLEEQLKTAQENALRSEDCGISMNQESSNPYFLFGVAFILGVLSVKCLEAYRALRRRANSIASWDGSPPSINQPEVVEAWAVPAVESLGRVVEAYSVDANTHEIVVADIEQGDRRGLTIEI